MVDRAARGRGHHMHGAASECAGSVPAGGGAAASVAVARQPERVDQGGAALGALRWLETLGLTMTELVLNSTIFRSTCFTPGRRDATATKKRFGTCHDQHRFRQGGLDSGTGIALPLCNPVCQGTCAKNGPAACQAHCGPNHTKQSESQHQSSRSPAPCACSPRSTRRSDSGSQSLSRVLGRQVQLFDERVTAFDHDYLSR